MDNFGNIFQQNSAQKFYCNICHYGTNRKCNYDTHIVSAKHTRNTQKKTLETNINTNQQKISENYHLCKFCNKIFKNRSGLWKHNKKCEKKLPLLDEDTIHIDNIHNDKNTIIHTLPPKNLDKAEIYELVKYLIKENSELKNMIVEVCKNVQPVNNTTNNNNCNNKTFNLNLFLNEQCKDAINMSDFIDSIVVNLSDLETTGRIGYAEGLSKLFITHLQKLDKHKRPIHCSDLKREVLYIKDENKWEKDSEDKQMLQRAIKEVTYKNIRQIAEWVKKYPDCRQSDSRKNDQYIRITMNSMSGGTEEEQEKNINKIIANIAKEVVIEK
jgi:hypothetical protein